MNSYLRLEDHYNILSDHSYAVWEPLVYDPQTSSNGRYFSPFEGLFKKWNTAAEYCAFFPNVLFIIHKGHAFAILLIPPAQNQTEERVAIHYANSAVCCDSFANMRKKI